MFLARDLSLETKQLVYQSVVLGMVQRPMQVIVKKLEIFHRRCVRCIMGIGKAVQWAQHITTIQLAEYFGMQETIGNLLSLTRLRKLGHVACTVCLMIAYQKGFCLDGYLTQDLPMVTSSSRQMFMEKLVAKGLKSLSTQSQYQFKLFYCETCKRSFRRAHQDTSA